MLNKVERGVADFLDIMRRNARRHTHSDARRTIGEQVREVGRQDNRLFFLAVIGLAEIDRVLVDAVEQRRRDRRKPRLGVSHGGCVIAVDIAEIALPIDQRIALRKALREPHQRVINGLIAMRVIFTDHVADDARAFLKPACGVELELAHGVKQPPVHRLEPVAHIGQRAVHDGGESVSEVALFKRVLQLDRLDRGGSENQFVSHASEVAGAEQLAKRAVALLNRFRGGSARHGKCARLLVPYREQHKQ